MNSKISTEYDGSTRTLFETNCGTCAKAIWLPKHLLKKTRYCSPECKGIANRNRVRLTCATCNDVFERSASKVTCSKSGLYFCKRACKDAAQRIGGIKEIQPDHFGTANGKFNYREKGLRAHGAKCNGCGYDKYIQMLDVHHKDSNRDNNLSENLEVLCVWCHALETRKVAMHGWLGDIKCGIRS